MSSNLEFLETVREDDFVEYFIFPSECTEDTMGVESNLQNYLKQINEVIHKYSKDYIWHRDPMSLIFRTRNYNLPLDGTDNDLRPHLYGVSHYGDNIEDEWFIVFLLYQISKEIDGLIVRVVDSDGEFLLIEAANYLPTWANPEVCERRVYIYGGCLHILQPQNLENLDDEEISIEAAILQINQCPQASLADASIQNSILNRIKGYPSRIKDNLHSTTVYLPVGVAAILKEKPSFIASAIQAFCNRDSIDIKACRAMKYFPPENRVYSQATFTKCLYAMLTHSKYVPDRRTGWNLPLTTSLQYKSHSLGVKLACGFEILASQAKPKSDLENDKGWVAYLANLKGKGYFKEFLEHSIDYNKLLQSAKEFYTNYRDGLHQAPAIGQEILDLIKNLDYNVDEFRKREKKLAKDDDDSWLNIDPKELDKMLEDQYGQKKSVTLNGNADARSFSQKIDYFLNTVSDLEGAEFPEPTLDKVPVRPPRSKKVNKAAENANSYKVNFDPNQFTCALESFFDYMIPEDNSWDLESDSDMSVYGEDKEVDLDCEGMKNNIEKYMKEMDMELAKTNIGKSFLKIEKNDVFDDVEDFESVDIDMNALKNVLESYQAQMGEAGPASNMLGPMGIQLQPGTSKTENGDLH